MPTDVIMPQMGESIFEGTITKWLKKPGDKVQRDEPLFEISTDKVDAEIPSPTAGVLQDIKVAEGTTVQVNTVVGTIAAEGEAAASPAKPQAAAPQAAPQQAPAQAKATAPVAPKAGAEETEIPTQLRERADVEPAAKSKEKEAVAKQADTVIEFPGGEEEGAEGERIRSSPLVRRIAREHKVNLTQVAGTGLGGRITKQDILAFVDKHPAGAPAPAARPAAAASAQQGPAARAGQPAYQPGAAAPAIPVPSQPAALPGDVVPLSNMRKIIAQRMVESRRTSAHVHSVFEVDMTRVVQLRNRQKAAFEQRTGTRMTFMPFFAKAAIAAIRQWPIINSSMDGDNIVYHREINLGIAVALDWGLIVPVVKHTEELSFLGLQRAITDVGERARTKKLRPDEVQGSTFTITNPGTFGAMFGLPIINQPNVAILGVGGLMKAPVVVTDANGTDGIAIRHLVHLSLGYDHRVIDGAVADQFMAQIKKNLEGWSEDVG